MKRFGIIDGIIYDMGATDDVRCCSALVELHRTGISVARPSWGWGFTPRAMTSVIPLEVLERYYKLCSTHKLATHKIKPKMYKKQVVRDNNISVISSDDGIAIEYGDFAIEVDGLSVRDFVNLCERLFGEGGEYNVIFKRN